MNLDTLCLLENIKRLTAIICLSVASFQDIKTREVSDKIWLPIILVGIAVNAVEKIWTNTSILSLYLLSIAITFLIALTLAYFGLMGGADAKAYICLSILETPSVSTNIGKMFPGISIFMNSIILSIFTMIIIAINNTILLFKSKLFFPKNISILKKIILFLSATIVDLKEVKKHPHKYFILSSTQNTIEIKTNIHNIDKCTEIIDILEKKGVEKVWVSPTLPFILFIFIGYILYLFIGNIIIYVFEIIF